VAQVHQTSTQQKQEMVVLELDTKLATLQQLQLSITQVQIKPGPFPQMLQPQHSFYSVRAAAAEYKPVVAAVMQQVHIHH
jgi:hypothetical protein